MHSEEPRQFIPRPVEVGMWRSSRRVGRERRMGRRGREVYIVVGGIVLRGRMRYEVGNEEEEAGRL